MIGRSRLVSPPRIVGRLAALALLPAAAGLAFADLRVSASGHYLEYDGEVLLLAGDSGTQCVLQDLNLDYRRWMDDCDARGIRAIHVWSFVAPRQKQDGSAIEQRYGYVYPGATPWARRDGGAPAFDQLPQWDLTRFDEGDDPTAHYWPRLRDVCAQARKRGIVVGITVFFGWPKHNRPERPDWSYHPFNVLNGGHLAEDRPSVEACQETASPGQEVLQEAWDPDWPPAKKTQWVWERFAQKLIDDTRPYGNVFFVFMDEHSYPEGNCGDHFAEFFRRRGALWVDWEARREAADVVMTPTLTAADKNGAAVKGFARTALWTFLIGGGHCFFHDDSDQGTPTRGIMGYDPKVAGGDTNPTVRGWIGHASRFFNERVRDLDAMAPHNELVKGGSAYCLANPGHEYAVYSPAGPTFALDLSAAQGARVIGRWYDPRTGRWLGDARPLTGAGSTEIVRPTDEDWALHITVR
jgi:hypothetical protein